MIIGLTGKNASGKGEAAEYLKKKSFTYYSLSDEIRLELKKQGLPETRQNLIVTGNRIRENEGPSALAKRIKEKISDKSIIDSIRNPKEVEELRSLPEFRLIAVDAPVDIRFKRAMARGRNENALTLEDFKKMEEKENSNDPKAQQLNSTIQLADINITNNGSVKELHEKIRIVLGLP